VGAVHVWGDGVVPVAHVGIGEERWVGERSVEAVLVVVGADGAGQNQWPAESSRGAYRDVLSFAGCDPAEDRDVLVLGGQRSSVCVLREWGGEVVAEFDLTVDGESCGDITTVSRLAARDSVTRRHA
jgi:hypothetical protein